MKKTTHIAPIEIDLLSLNDELPLGENAAIYTQFHNLGPQDRRTLMLVCYPPTRQWLRAFAWAANEGFNKAENSEEKDGESPFDTPEEVVSTYHEFKKVKFGASLKVAINSSINASIVSTLDKLKIMLLVDEEAQDCTVRLKLGYRFLVSKMPVEDLFELPSPMLPKQYEFYRELGYSLVLIGPDAKKKKVLEIVERIKTANKKETESLRDQEQGLIFTRTKFYRSVEIPDDTGTFEKFIKRCSGESWTEAGSSDINKLVKPYIDFTRTKKIDSKWEGAIGKAGNRDRKKWVTVLRDFQNEDFKMHKEKFLKSLFREKIYSKIFFEEFGK